MLAGGQSLLPVLRLRMAAPELIVDLGRIAELRGVRDDGDAIVIGAMTTHDDVTREPLIRQHALLLAEAARTVADPQVRHRGTFGGSLAHADPAGDMPAPALALDAEFVIAGQSRTPDRAGVRVLPGPLHDGARRGRAARRDPGAEAHRLGRALREVQRCVAQAWSIVAVAAAVRVEGGAIAEAKVALTNMGLVPIRAHAVEEALVGRPGHRRRRPRGGGPGRPGDVADGRRQRRRGLPPPPGDGPHRSRGARGGGSLISVELQHTFTVPAPVDAAWETLLDVEGIAPCFPGAALTSVEGDDFAGTVKVKLGPVSLQYAGKGRFVERDEAARRVTSRPTAATSGATARPAPPCTPGSSRPATARPG